MQGSVWDYWQAIVGLVAVLGVWIAWRQFRAAGPKTRNEITGGSRNTQSGGGVVAGFGLWSRGALWGEGAGVCHVAVRLDDMDQLQKGGFAISSICNVMHDQPWGLKWTKLQTKSNRGWMYRPCAATHMRP
ncbi:hypothetical protein [Thalassovita taeanensis]|uniref:hypothetical protein n=1 Tax=Thalassovita taeanensis TaxID=657014 RepID=UPI001114EF2E|nr:hypothetical protein [Thalassovita taeanensis]